MDIIDLTNALYDDNGPAKIGLELQVEENNKKIESNVSDLFEFLINVAIIGIMKFQLQLATVEDINSVELKLQHYFNKINVNVYMNVVDGINNEPPYCNVLFDGTNFSLQVMKTRHICSSYNLSDFTAMYQIPSDIYICIRFEFGF